MSRLGFEVFLLPSPEHRQLWHSAARFPDNGALQPDAPSGLDDDAIEGLLTEVRQIIGSAKFGVALKVGWCGELFSQTQDWHVPVEMVCVCSEWPT